MKIKEDVEAKRAKYEEKVINTINTNVHPTECCQIKKEVRRMDESGSKEQVDENKNKPVPEIKVNLDELKRSFEVERLSIRRDHKLTVKTKLELWLDYLRSELRTNDLLDVIYEEIEGKEGLSEKIILKRKSIVRDIIINHLDENYHRRIIDVTEPKDIIKKLKEFKRNETNVPHSSIRVKLYSMKMSKREKIYDFWEKFDGVIRKYKNCEAAQPLSQGEKRAAFYQAVSGVVPELRSADLIKRQTGGEMTIDEIKAFIAQLEAEWEADETPKASRVYTKMNNCYICNQSGHHKDECHLQALGLKFCYVCKKIVSHDLRYCPQAQGASKERGRGKGNYQNTFSDRFKINNDRKYRGEKNGRECVHYCNKPWKQSNYRRVNYNDRTNFENKRNENDTKRYKKKHNANFENKEGTSKENSIARVLEKKRKMSVDYNY